MYGINPVQCFTRLPVCVSCKLYKRTVLVESERRDEFRELRLITHPINDKIEHLQPDPRRECCQLLDKIADQFDDRTGSCDAVAHPSETTDCLVRRQMRPCRAPDGCSAARPIRPLNSLTAGMFVSVAKRKNDTIQQHIGTQSV